MYRRTVTLGKKSRILPMKLILVKAKLKPEEVIKVVMMMLQSTHSHDKTPEAFVIDKQTLPEDSSEATCANTDVQNPSSTATEESSKDEQDEAYSSNRQSSQSQSAICDKDNAKGAAEDVNEGTTDGQESEKQVKAQHVINPVMNKGMLLKAKTRQTQQLVLT